MLSSKASAEPGRWRTSRTPYLKAIMDCLSPTSPVERVVFMKAAQFGATEMGNNWIGYVIHHAPGPMMAVWPTVEMAKRNSKQRIDPLIEESPVLAELIAPARSRDSGNTILAKEFRGGVLVMTGANSAVGLRSMPVRYLFLDEVDGYPLDVDGEGDAIALAEARTRTFARRKIFIVSTPTIAGRQHHRAGVRGQRPAPLLRAVSALRAPAVAALRATALGADEDGNARRPRPTSANPVRCRFPSTTRPGCWSTANGGRWREGASETAGFHLSSACTARSAGAVGARSPPPGRVPSARNPDRRPRSRPSRTPNSVKPGSRKAKRPTGSACWSAARTTGSGPSRRAACC